MSTSRHRSRAGRLLSILLAAALLGRSVGSAQAPEGLRGILQRTFDMARALEQAGLVAEARAQYGRVLEREERHLPALHALAMLEKRAGDVDAALDHAGRFLDLWRYTKPPPRELGPAHEELRRLVAEADPLRKRLDALRRTYVGKLLALAGQQMDKAAWHSARAVLVEAIATDPEHPELAAGLLRIRLEGGNELAVEDETGGSDPLAGVSAEWVEREDPLHADWANAWTLDTPHYRIRTNAGYRLLRTVGHAMEQMHAFYRIFHQYKLDGGAVPVAGVHIFKNAKEYKDIGGSPVEWAAGHWDGSTVVTYDQRGGGEGSLRGTLQVLFHEASHQFTTLAGGSGVPAWLNEGMASFFEGTRLLSNGRVEWNLVAQGRLYPLIEDLEKPDRHRLEQIVRGAVDDYRIYYPWGWGIVYYLYNAEDEAGRLCYRHLLHEYFKTYAGGDHVARFTDYFVTRAKQPGVNSLEDFEQRLIAAIHRYAAEDRGTVDAARAYEERGDLQVALGDFARAIELYERSLRREPDHPEVLWKLANALERAGLADRAAGTLRQWLTVVELDADRTRLAEERRAEAARRIEKLDPTARRLAQTRAAFHADAVALAGEYRALGLPRTALRVLRGPATATPPSLAARELYFAIQDATGLSLESWRLLFNETDLSGFYGDGLENFRVREGVLLARIVAEERERGRRAEGEGGEAPVTGRERRAGTSFLFRRLFIDRQPAGDFSLAAEVALGADARMAGLCFGKKQDERFHGLTLLPEGFLDLSAFEVDGTPLVRIAVPLEPDWNHLQVDVAGTRLVASVNGQIVIEHQFATRAALQGDFGLLAGEGSSSFREIKLLEYDRQIPRRQRIGRRPSGARVSDAGVYAQPERAPAGAQSFLGSAPPLLRGLSFVSPAPQEGELDRLLGWPVLLVFTKTGVEATHPVLPVLAAVEERYGELEIPVLIVSNEQHEVVQAWAQEKGLRWPMASGWQQEAYQDYALARHGIPRMLLLDLDGTVVWEGNPDYEPEHGSYLDQPLADLVERRKLRELHAALAALERAEEAFGAGLWAEAWAAWAPVASLGVEHPRVALARAGLARIEERAAEEAAAAARLGAEGRVLQAHARMQQVASSFAGARAAAQAAERAQELARTREHREALRAANRIARAEKQLLAGKLDALRTELEQVLAKATPADDPWVEERARWLLEGLAGGVPVEELAASYRARWPELGELRP